MIKEVSKPCADPVYECCQKKGSNQVFEHTEDYPISEL